MSVMGLGLGVWVGIAAAWTAPPTTIPLELFLDDQRIAVRSGLRRVVKPPARHPWPVITSEHAWEHNLALYGTVLYDPDLQRYRAWYFASNAGRTDSLSSAA